MKITELFDKPESGVGKLINKVKNFVNGNDEEETEKNPEADASGEGQAQDQEQTDAAGDYTGPYSEYKSVKFSDKEILPELEAFFQDVSQFQDKNESLLTFLKECNFTDLFDYDDLLLLKEVLDSQIVELDDLQDNSSSNPFQKTAFYNNNIPERTFIAQTWLWFKIHGKEDQDLGNYIDNIENLAKIDKDCAEKLKKAKKDPEKINSILKSKWNDLAEKIIYKGTKLNSVENIKEKVNSLKLDETEVNSNQNSNQSSNNTTKKPSKKQVIKSLINYRLTEDDLVLLQDIIEIKKKEINKSNEN